MNCDEGRVVVTSHDDVTAARFSIRSRSHLVISDVRANDSGLYMCTEDGGFGAKHPVVLCVMEDGKMPSI